MKNLSFTVSPICLPRTRFILITLSYFCMISFALVRKNTHFSVPFSSQQILFAILLFLSPLKVLFLLSFSRDESHSSLLSIMKVISISVASVFVSLSFSYLCLYISASLTIIAIFHSNHPYILNMVTFVRI